MRGKGICSIICFIFGMLISWGQVSPDCRTAVPICSDTPVNGGTSGYGEDDFFGQDETGCLEETASGAVESNSAWYRFRTAASGQLGFNIGFDTLEDWDFALYKASDCGDLGDPIRCNFYDNRDKEQYMGVGESPDGMEDTVLFEDWLQVEPGEDYYLLINNFSNSNSGFSIQFTGEIFEDHPYDALDCSIISNLLGPPIAACDNEDVVLDATMGGAVAYHWYRDTGSGFELLPSENQATLEVTTDAFYRVLVELPDDTVISDVQVGFSPAPQTYPLEDMYFCSGQGNFNLQDLDATALGPQKASAVRVSYHTTLEDAFTGNSPLENNFILNPGTHTIFVRTTSIDNSQCFDLSQEFEIQVDESPEIHFDTEVYICESRDAISIGPETPVPGYSYVWENGSTDHSIAVDREGRYELLVRNEQGGCEDVFTIEVVISLSPAISEVKVDDFRTENRVEIITHIPGDFIFRMDGGSEQNSGVFEGVSPGLHEVSIIDPKGCGVVKEMITVVGFSRFFTPNGDGQNDRWIVHGLEVLADAELTIFDRFGRRLARLRSNSPGWDGTFQGTPMPEADYWFSLSYVDPRNGRVEARKLSNHFSLKREK